MLGRFTNRWCLGKRRWHFERRRRLVRWLYGRRLDRGLRIYGGSLLRRRHRDILLWRLRWHRHPWLLVSGGHLVSLRRCWSRGHHLAFRCPDAGRHHAGYSSASRGHLGGGTRGNLALSRLARWLLFLCLDGLLSTTSFCGRVRRNGRRLHALRCEFFKVSSRRDHVRQIRGRWRLRRGCDLPALQGLRGRLAR